MASSILLSDNGASSGTAGLKSTAGNDGVLLLQTTTSGGTATTAVTLDNAQNMGLGVTPSAWLSSTVAMQLGNYGSIFAFKNSGNVYLNNNLYTNSVGNEIYLNTAPAGRYRISDNTHLWYSAPSGTAGTSATLTQAMTLDASGNLLVGATSQFSSGLVCISADNSVKNPISIKNTGTTYGAGYHLILFSNSSGTQCGAIDQTAVTTVNYNTSSDARLKEDNGVATDTSVVDNIVIRDFVWKADGRADRGVFAQEAYEVKPSAISVGKDDLTEDGNLAQPWGVDYSKFVPDLIVHAQQLKKQVQEQQAIITQLQADVAALKGTP